MWASPAIDLYLATSCATPEVFETHSDEFISYYHQEFVETLKSFGFLKAPPTLIDLHVELMRHGGLFAIVNLAFAPFMFMDPSKISPGEMITGNDGFRIKKSVLQTEDCVKHMKKKVKEFVNKGWL